MAKLTRNDYKIFGSSATGNNGVFGSAAAGMVQTSADVDVLQSLDAYTGGWDAATLSALRLPALEDMQSLQYITTYGLKYLYQMGIPEWSATETYYVNSICQYSNAWYRSILDDNTNQAPDTATTYWKKISSGGGAGSGGPIGTILAYSGATLPEGYLSCNGASLLRADYPELFAAIGTIYGAADADHFNLPAYNTSSLFLQGSTTAGTVKAAGLPNIIGTIGIDNNAYADGCFGAPIGQRNGGGNYSGNNHYYTFNASYSNAIYGASTTVQPPAQTVIYIISYE